MKSIKEHIDSLSKHTNETKEDIIHCLFENEKELTNDSLLCWSIHEEVEGFVMYVLFASGDGLKLIERIKEIARDNQCVRIYCVTQRPKGMEKKFGFKPVGTLMKMEVEK